MASSYSDNLRLELIGTGDQAGSWGATTNTNLGTAIEQAIVGKADSVSFEYGPEGDTSTFAKYTGECFLTSYEKSGGLGDVVKFSAEFQVTGAITLGTYS